MLFAFNAQDTFQVKVHSEAGSTCSWGPLM